MPGIVAHASDPNMQEACTWGQFKILSQKVKKGWRMQLIAKALGSVSNDRGCWGRRSVGLLLLMKS